MTTSTLIECRAEYIAGSVILILRWFTRCKTVGIRGWYWDDWFTVSSWIFFTLIYAMIEYLSITGAPIGMDQAAREALTPEMRISFQKGAKGMFASFYFLICLVWSLKGTLIVLFLRLTKDTKLHFYIKMVAGISVLCFVTALVTQSTHCTPLERNWQILPDPGKECSEGIAINIVVAIGNVLVDALLVVPTLMLKDAHISRWRKIKIVFLLSLGVFVIGMAITRCVQSIGDAAAAARSSEWVEREALVTIFAVNAPALNALFRRETWSTRKTTSSAYGSKGGAFSVPSTEGRKTSRIEIYKMTNIETSSKESTSNLVFEGAILPQRQQLHSANRGKQQVGCREIV